MLLFDHHVDSKPSISTHHKLHIKSAASSECRENTTVAHYTATRESKKREAPTNAPDNHLNCAMSGPANAEMRSGAQDGSHLGLMWPLRQKLGEA